MKDVAFKLAGVPHEYLGEGKPHERLTGQVIIYTRVVLLLGLAADYEALGDHEPKSGETLVVQEEERKLRR